MEIMTQFFGPIKVSKNLSDAVPKFCHTSHNQGETHLYLYHQGNQKNQIRISFCVQSKSQLGKTTSKLSQPCQMTIINKTLLNYAGRCKEV